MRRAGAEIWVGIGLVVLIVWLSLLPLVRVAVVALSSHGAFVSPALVRALGRSVVTSLGGSAIAVLFGGAYAGAVGLTDVPCRRVLAAAALLPLLIPAQIIALAWMQMVSPAGLLPVGHGTALFSPSGIILLLGVEHVPIVFLALSAALRAIPTELFEAARADGARAARLVCRIVLPLSAPGLAAAFGLAALSSLGSFGIPAMIGIPARYPTLAVLIYQRLSGFGTAALPDVAAMALCLAAIAALAARVTALAGRGADLRGLGGAASSGYRIELGAWRFALLGGLLALAVVTVLLPMVSLLTTSFSRAYGVRLSAATATIRHYTAVLDRPETADAFVTSAWLSAGAAIGAVTLALPLAALRHWGTRRLQAVFHLLDPVIDAPYALPGIVLAIGMILLYLAPLPLIRASLYGTPWIMLLAYIARFLPLGVRPVAAALRAIDPVVDEAARAQGAKFLHRLAAITAPMLTPAAAGAAVLVLLTAFGELTVSALLWSPGSETVGVLIFSLNEGGDVAQAAAVSVLCLAAVFAVVGLTALLPASARKVLPWSA